VPTSATDYYTLVARVTDNGQPIGPAQTSEGSITTKMGIWFVSDMNDTLEKAADATFEDLTQDALKKLIDSKQIRAKS
jgi:exo-beta-1,3-glucanase (GH17 family)